MKMELWQGVVLGILQGVAEFLPISSSGHLLVLRNLLELDNIPVLFDVLLHLATLFAILLVFRRKIGAILVSIARFIVGKSDKKDSKNLLMVPAVIIATIFTAGIGLVIEPMEVERMPKLTFLFFIITGFILIFIRFYKGKGIRKGLIVSGLITGIAQGFGILPGISRSGITISAARFSGMTREDAGELSFLIAIPAILGAVVLDLKDSESLFSQVTPFVLTSSFLVSFFVGIASLVWLLKLLKVGKLYYFSYYLIPLGIIGLIFF